MLPMNIKKKKKVLVSYEIIFLLFCLPPFLEVSILVCIYSNPFKLC